MEVKIDGDKASNSFNPKQREDSEHTKDPDGSSLLYLVKDPKWV